MKRKTIASYPVLLAGIIMMLSFFIPHHHHSEAVCFSIAHCAEGESEDACSHGHDDSTEAPCSIQSLQQADITRGFHPQPHFCAPAIPDFIPLLSIIEQWACDALILTGTTAKVTFPTYRERLHPSDWSVTRAGRAPPVAIA